MITVYIDVLFIVNFIVNILILEGTSLIMREETKAYKTLMAAGVGALYAVAIFFVDIGTLQGSVLKLLVSVVIVFIGFPYKSGKVFLKILGSFYLVSLIFGGGVIAILSMTNLGMKMGAIYSNGAVYVSLPWQILILSSAVTYFLIAFFSRVRRKNIQKAKIERKLTIYVQNKKIDVAAIIDTGNTLCEPISGSPVIVCEYGLIESILPKGEESILEKMVKAKLKIRMIPFSAVGNENGMMIGFLPDRIEVDNCEAKRCVVGICENKLSADCAYHALLNPMVMVNTKTLC